MGRGRTVGAKHKFVGEDEYDSPAINYMRNAASSGALLKLLSEHHDFNMRVCAPPPPVFVAPKPAPEVARPPVVKKLDPDVFGSVEIRSSVQDIRDIKQAVVTYFGLSSRVDLDSSRKTKVLYFPRQIAMYLCKARTNKSFPEIGRRFGGRDHTTVMHAVNKIGELLRYDWVTAYHVAMIEIALDHGRNT